MFIDEKVRGDAKSRDFFTSDFPRIPTFMQKGKRAKRNFNLSTINCLGSFWRETTAKHQFLENKKRSLKPSKLP
jgi:hypothetical protein